MLRGVGMGSTPVATFRVGPLGRLGPLGYLGPLGVGCFPAVLVVSPAVRVCGVPMVMAGVAACASTVVAAGCDASEHLE